jgi:hypothetical protein
MLEMSEEEKKVILEKHKEATRKFYQKIADDKAGLQFKKSEKPVETKKEEPSK